MLLLDSHLIFLAGFYLLVPQSAQVLYLLVVFLMGFLELRQLSLYDLPLPLCDILTIVAGSHCGFFCFGLSQTGVVLIIMFANCPLELDKVGVLL